MFINNHSYFSLRYGTVAPESILKIAQKQGIKTLALTDINNTSASLDFVRMAPKYNINPVLGVDFRNNGIQKFIILAQNNNGFQQINTYLSPIRHKYAAKTRYYLRYLNTQGPYECYRRLCSGSLMVE